ncbi:hypothetical protein AJ80_00126 [Polytolypa hystricis UAMH7299]|uniref:Uncharacterized protein n=1 Tax=Polytolypa hystricis (strain UAMH7299) TaxID=1447883 RepID=A0A2B7Z3R3_POLH7|nr:hypothetical protein AJ80_00126 [Polytolypa hystricis UAMH7299]
MNAPTQQGISPSKPDLTSTDETPPEAIRIDCSVYGGLSSPNIVFNRETIKANEIGSWLRKPNLNHQMSYQTGSFGKYVTRAQDPTYILMGPRLSIEDVKAAIQSQFASSCHPLLIPVLLAELAATELMYKIEDLHVILSDIEIETGFGDCAYSKTMDMSRFTYHQLARWLAVLGCKFASVDSGIQGTIMMNDFTVREIKSMKDNISDVRFRALKDSAPDLIDRLDFLTSNLRHIQIYAGVNRRIQAQQNGVFNLIAQEDSQLNVEIARDSKELAASSKRDSAAMKIAAFLTTLFLPATFVSWFLAPFPTTTTCWKRRAGLMVPSLRTEP